MTLLLIKLLATSLFLLFVSAVPNTNTKELYNIQNIVVTVLTYTSILLAVLFGLSVIWIV